MSSPIVDRNGGATSSSPSVVREAALASSAAVKGPVRGLSTTAITLSGEQTLQSIALVTGDRWAAGGQADSTLNGIYIVSTGAWQRAADFNRNDDVVNGSLLVVTGGSNAGLWAVSCATSPAHIGTTAITFSSFPAVAGYAPIASPAFTGNPTAPTPSPGDADTSIATTGFVAAVSTAILAVITALGAFADNMFFITGSADATKKLRFEVDGITAGQTRVATPPDSNFAMAALDVQQQTLAGGANVTVKDLGALSAAGSNTITPNPGDRPIQKITNDHAGSILPGANAGQYSLEVINATGAGALTTTGWTLKGDSFDTTAASKFLCSCIVTADLKVMIITKVA